MKRLLGMAELAISSLKAEMRPYIFAVVMIGVGIIGISAGCVTVPGKPPTAISETRALSESSALPISPSETVSTVTAADTEHALSSPETTARILGILDLVREIPSVGNHAR